MVMRPPFLSDDLPMGEWQRRRNLQAAGLEPVALPGAPAVGLSDDLPMDEWQRIRTLEAQGRDEVLYGGQGGGTVTGGGGDDTLAGGSARLGDRRYGVGPLFGMIAKGEGTDGADGYDTIYGYDRYKPSNGPTLSEMTLDQVAALQAEMLRRGSPSTAVGKYQFIAGTLGGLRDKLGLKGSELMTPELQDRLAHQLLTERKYYDYMAGRISAEKFQEELSKEWSSLAKDSEDYSYYPNGKSRVKARVGTADIQRAIAEAKRAEEALDDQLDGGYAPPP